MNFERFILIDDNELDNVYHEIIIRRAGFLGDVLVFEKGSDALTFFESADLTIPTGVFLDINMPIMDGFEFAESVAPLIENKPTVVLVMLTSSGASADRKRAEEIPIIKGYLTKPLTVDGVKELMSAGLEP